MTFKLLTKSRARLVLLKVARTFGGFAISRWLTRKGLRVLCYHGIWLGESHFSNFLFMSEAKFKRRIELIKKWDFPVLSLDQAIRGLENGTLPKCATVITIDDGWFGTFKIMVPELIAQGLPATIYSTSYFSEKQLPVFDVALEYILTRAAPKVVDLASVDDGLSGDYQLADVNDRELLAERLSEHAGNIDALQAFQLLARLAKRLDINFQSLVEKRVFHLMSVAEIKAAAEQGVDIQLHTHRHRFPVDDPGLLRQEIDDNRRALSPLTTKPLKHFCYPSGVWTRAAFGTLSSLGIETAVTTEQGLNFSAASTLNLRRISDGEYVDELQFEAELSGFAEIVRRVRGRFGK